jgi:hypothetical protein
LRNQESAIEMERDFLGNHHIDSIAPRPIGWVCAASVASKAGIIGAEYSGYGPDGRSEHVCGGADGFSDPERVVSADVVLDCGELSLGAAVVV